MTTMNVPAFDFANRPMGASPQGASHRSASLFARIPAAFAGLWRRLFDVSPASSASAQAPSADSQPDGAALRRNDSRGAARAVPRGAFVRVASPGPQGILERIQAGTIGYRSHKRRKRPTHAAAAARAGAPEERAAKREAAPDAPPASPPPNHTGTLSRIRDALSAVPALRVARQGLVLAALLVGWISLKPFADLSRLDIADLVTGQEGLTYATFALFAVAAFGLAWRDHRQALASLVSPAFIGLAGWICVSVVLSQDHATSAKRLTITAAVAGLTACLPLLVRSRSELRNLFAIACLTLMAACYLGMILVPHLSIHQADDLMEPLLAGDWRGVFGHKNGAAAVTAMILMIGVAVFRARAYAAGALIVFASALFLWGSEGKSAFALTFAVFAITGAFTFVRSLAGRLVLTLGPIALLNLFSVGTVLNDGLAKIVASLPIDPTFTGRTAIWGFAADNFMNRPIAGYGYAAFWGSQVVRDVSDDGASWAGYAAHSHNGYLDTALTLGAVGLVLTLAALAVKPLLDYHRAEQRQGGADPFATMFLQIWLFGLMLSSMESFFFDRSDPIWFTFLIAVFGLHYLGRFRIR